MKKTQIATSQSSALGAGLVVLSSLLYGSYAIWIKKTGDHFSGYSATAIRSLLVLLLLVPVGLKLGKLQKIQLRKNWFRLLGMTGASVLIWGPLYYAILQAGAGISFAVNYACYVIGMFIFGWLFFREKFTRHKAVATLLGVIGLGLIFVRGDTHLGTLPLLAAVVSGLATAAVMGFSKKLTYNATQSTIALWATGFIANAGMIIATSEPLPSIQPDRSWAYLFTFALASFGASLLMVNGLKLVDTGVAGLLGLLEVISAIFFGVVFFGVRPSHLVYAGAGIIVVAAAIPYLSTTHLRNYRKNV